jgi:hypothetical protein
MLNLPSDSTLKHYMGSQPRRPGLAIGLIQQYVQKLEALARAEIQRQADSFEPPAPGRVNAIFLGCLSFDEMQVARDLKHNPHTLRLDGLATFISTAQEVVDECAALAFDEDIPLDLRVANKVLQIYWCSFGTPACIPVYHIPAKGLTCRHLKEILTEVRSALNTGHLHYRWQARM